MKVKKQTQLKIKIKGDDISNLKSVIDKMINDSKQVGFNNKSFTDDEHKVLKTLADSLK